MPFKTKWDWSKEIETIKQMGKDGVSLQKIADYYGLTRQRIQQITKQHGLSWREEYGARQATRERRAIDEVAFKTKWGEKEATDLYLSKRAKFRAKKANAKRVGWDWTVEFGDLDWPTHCPIFGLELDYFADSSQENSPSFDRIDPTKGYVEGNVQILSWRANRIKNDGSAKEHQMIAEYMLNKNQ